MNAVLEWLFTGTILGSVVGILIFFLHKLFRFSPKWNYLIWMILLFKLLIPFGPESSVSLFNLAKPVEFVVPQMGVGQAVGEVGMVTGWKAAEEGRKLAPEPAAGFPEETRKTDWTRVLSAVWLTGAALLAAWFFAAGLLFRRKLRKSVLPDDPRVRAVFESCAGPKATLVTQGSTMAPSVFGLFRPKVLVHPSASRLEDAQLRYVFLHEFAHLRRGDLWMNLLLLVLQIIHWFNPVLWFLFYQIRKDMELAADAAAMERLPQAEYKAYGQALITLLEGYQPMGHVPQMLGLVDEKRNVKQRVRSIAAFRKPKVIWSLAAGVVVVLVAVVCLTSAMGGGTYNHQQGSAASQVQEYLREIVEGANPASSNPYDAIKQNQAPFDQLVALGNDGLEAMYTMFESSRDNGLKEYVMAVACSRITGLVPEDGTIGSGREWYERYGKSKYDGKALLQYQTPYVGDNSKVGNILSNLAPPRGTERTGFALQTEAQPYGITIHLKERGLEYQQYHYEADAEAARQALILFSLIENVDAITFDFPESGTADSQRFYRSWAEDVFSQDVRSFTEKLSDFNAFLKKVEGYLKDSRSDSIKQALGPDRNVVMNSGIGFYHVTIEQDIDFEGHFALSDVIQPAQYRGHTLQFLIYAVDDVRDASYQREWLFVLDSLTATEGMQVVGARELQGQEERAAAVQVLTKLDRQDR